MSSAKSSQHALMNRFRSLMSIEKGNSPRTEPLGYRYLTESTSDVGAFTYTVYCCL